MFEPKIPEDSTARCPFEISIEVRNTKDGPVVLKKLKRCGLNEGHEKEHVVENHRGVPVNIESDGRSGR